MRNRIRSIKQFHSCKFKITCMQYKKLPVCRQKETQISLNGCLWGSRVQRMGYGYRMNVCKGKGGGGKRKETETGSKTSELKCHSHPIKGIYTININ